MTTAVLEAPEVKEEQAVDTNINLTAEMKRAVANYNRLRPEKNSGNYQEYFQQANQKLTAVFLGTNLFEQRYEIAQKIEDKNNTPNYSIH